MIRIATLASLAALLVLASCSQEKESKEKAAVQAAAQTGYTPQAQFCVTPRTGGSPLCPKIPGDIGPDPLLAEAIAYHGLPSVRPTSADKDVQTPFDNLSWQTFVALNWTKGKENEPAEKGLQGDGPRVWEGWPRVAEIFGNGPVQADCGAALAPGVTVFSIASDGQSNPVANNEEYVQAATDDPLIDVQGNWTIYERRLNDIEVAYLRAPIPNVQCAMPLTRCTLTTFQGQTAFIASNGTVDFPAAGPNGTPATGAIEIKAAWRVLDPTQHEQNKKKYYLVPALLKVASDLVRQRTPICAKVDMGLVAMHIIQKNPKPTSKTKNLLPQWFWSTFEHVDNAPIAKNACDPASPLTCAWLDKPTPAGKLNCTAERFVGPPKFSFFNTICPDCPVNQPPQPKKEKPYYEWSATQPFAQYYPSGVAQVLGTQVSRCWKVYSLTGELNRQWHGALAQVGSVFQNYMLVGTQWGGDITETPNPKIPPKTVPSYLSNTVVETYLQTLYDPKNVFGTGSCVSCHSAAVLTATKTSGASVPSNLSFLPYLVRSPGSAPLVREEMLEKLKQRQRELQQERPEK
jgi:hypothetical protein